MREAFERIYTKEAWGKGKGSGTGSSPVYCAAYLRYLGELLLAPARVLDIGCGDWQLYKGFIWPAHVHYVGVDIVETNVQRNSLIHSARNIEFVHTDVTANMHALFKRYGPFDLVLAKDVLQHWSNMEVARWLATMRQLEWRTIVVANNWRHFRSPAKNEQPRDINNAYRWAPIDMRKYGFKDVLYYPAGKFKQVARLDNMEDIL